MGLEGGAEFFLLVVIMESSLLLAVAAAYCTACVLGRTCYTDVGHSCWCDFASERKRLNISHFDQ